MTGRIEQGDLATSEDHGAVQLVRWYTRARKFPKLIGKTPSGSRLWGGPYTVTQVVVGVVWLVIAAKSMALWGHFGLFMNVAVLLGTTFGVIKATGLVPLDARSPISVSRGVVAVMSGNRWGVQGRRKVRYPKTHTLRGGAAKAELRYSTQPATPPPAASPSMSATGSPRRRSVVESGVQRLLTAPATRLQESRS